MDTVADMTPEDDGRTKKRFFNIDYYHKHGYDACEGQNIRHCIFPGMCHEINATAKKPMNGCLLYKHLSHCK